MASYGESPVAGILYGYIANIAQGVLALLYVVILTRFIGLEEYGYYNALLSIIGIIGLFFPTLDIDKAVAREAAMIRPRGVDLSQHFSALLLISLILGSAYISAMIIAIPLYIAHNIPRGFIGIAYLYAIYVLLQSLVGAFSSYLWALGRVRTQAIGVLMYSFVFRVVEIILIYVMRSVYAIVLSMIIGQISGLAYYLYIVRSFPNPLKGLGILRRGFKQYAKLGFQSWIIGYLSTINSITTTYIIYNTLGAEYVAIYTIASHILGGVSALISAVSNVFSSRLAYALGSKTFTGSMVRDYSISSAVFSALIAQVGILGLPLLPILGIVYGEYSRAIPLSTAIIGSAVLGSPASIYTMYYWVGGTGWVAVRISMLAVAMNLAIVASLAPMLGIWSVAFSSYLVNSAVLALYTAVERSRISIDIALFTATYTFPTIISALLYLYGYPWPVSQILVLALSTALTIYIKPVPGSVLDQLPEAVRPLIRIFASGER